MTLGFRFHFLTAIIASLFVLPLMAQALDVPQVPPVIRFADMTLHLTEQAQRDIQADVDALYRSPKYFYMKLERVDMYLPIIEPIFAEMGIPDDIKYLVIQESALISDAISSSKAVGFWQFKEASATELGMRVDRQVDERMNIVASTVGAAKYLLRSNATFDNWLYSLQSYQMGLGGATRSLNDRYYGAREMRIDSDTYWYVKKFLSHLVAFRDAIGKQPRSLMLYQYKNTANKDLRNIAEEFNTEPDLLIEYNKWLKASRVPDDREYVVIIPVHLEEAPNLLAESQATANKQQKNQKKQSLEDKLFGEKQKEPEVSAAMRDKLVLAEVNGIRAAVARKGDNARDLAKAGGISVASFLKFNDIKPGDVLKSGQVYYFRKKKKKATVYRHVVAEGETLWDVSQKYGIRMDKLLQKNRMNERDGVKPGQVLWLRYIRPANEPVAFEAVPKQKEEPANSKSDKKVGAVSAPVQQEQPPQIVREEKPKPAQAQAREGAPAEKTSPRQEQPSPARTESVVKKQQQQQVSAVYQQPQEQSAAALAKPVAQEQVARQQTVTMLVDTPVVKPAPKAPEQSKKKEVADSTKAVPHLYPGGNNGQRNVYPQKKENAEAAGMQVIERPKQAAPDSFGVQGPVKFIGEDGKPQEQQPVRTAPVQTQKSAEQPAMQAPAQKAPAAPAQVVQSQPAALPAQDSVHVVQAGETLYSLSKRYGLTVPELRAMNNMGPDTPLSIGQELRLKPLAGASVKSQVTAGQAPAQQASAATSEDGRYEYHTVAEGETMYRVARKYNVTIKDIMEWNKKEDFNIRPGEVLIVGRK